MVDDGKLILITSVLELEIRPTNELLGIKTGVVLNTLTLNAAKTHHLFFFYRNKDMLAVLSDITMTGVPLKRCSSKDLAI